MWWSERRSVLACLSALALLTACGFAPVHAPGGAGAALRGTVQAGAPQDPLDFAFVAAVEQRIGRAALPRLALDYDIDTTERGGARVPELGDTRIQIFGTASFALRDLAADTELVRGKVQNFTSYSATSTQLATRAAREDAERRLMAILADLLISDLIARLPDRATEPAP